MANSLIKFQRHLEILLEIQTMSKECIRQVTVEGFMKKDVKYAWQELQGN